jgi:hypothetical protein
MKLEPESSLAPKIRRPVTLEEEMSMRFINILAKRAYMDQRRETEDDLLFAVCPPLQAKGRNCVLEETITPKLHLPTGQEQLYV